MRCPIDCYHLATGKSYKHAFNYPVPCSHALSTLGSQLMCQGIRAIIGPCACMGQTHSGRRVASCIRVCGSCAMCACVWQDLDLHAVQHAAEPILLHVCALHMPSITEYLVGHVSTAHTQCQFSVAQLRNMPQRYLTLRTCTEC